MFVNAEEHYGLKEHERPNWINFVREPIERLVSLYYFIKCHPKERPNDLLFKTEMEMASNFTSPENHRLKRSLTQVQSDLYFITLNFRI